MGMDILHIVNLKNFEFMNNILKYINEEYFEFRRMNEFWDPESLAIAFNIEDALEILDILRSKDVVLFGGDLMCEDDDMIKYVYLVWGMGCCISEWQSDEPTKYASKVGYLKKWYVKAKKAILKLIDATSDTEYHTAKEGADEPSKFANEIKYLDDSYAKAKKAILQFIKSSKKYENKCYIVFSVGEKLSWLTTPLGPYYPI